MHSELKKYSVQKKNISLLNVWTQWKSKIIQSSLQFDADSHFFTNQNNSFSCSFLKICTTAQIYIGNRVV